MRTGNPPSARRDPAKTIDTAHIHELTLESFAYGGDTIGHLEDGRAIFVPFGIPGEKVRVQITEEKHSYVRGEIVEALITNPDRIKPKCRHFQSCGGCHYQHIPYPNQLTIKQGLFTDQLQRNAGYTDPPVKPIVPSGQPFYYRNTIQFHLSPQGKLGYLAVNSHDVLEIAECHLPVEGITSIWPQLSFDAAEEMERIELRIGSDDQVMMTIQSDSPELPEMDTDLPISVVHQSLAGSLVIAGDNFVLFQVLEKTFRVTSGSFFQVNTAQAEKMVTHLLENLPLTQETTFLDVYCGVGLFSAFIAPRVKRCIGIEIASNACDDYAFNLDAHDNVELYQGKAEMILPSLDVEPDLVVVDPPRAGLDKNALQAIVSLHPAHITYVSCDPSTLARDLHRFGNGGYVLTSTQPFDLFPQTYHIESISFLQKVS